MVVGDTSAATRTSNVNVVSIVRKSNKVTDTYLLSHHMLSVYGCGLVGVVAGAVEWGCNGGCRRRPVSGGGG